MGGRERRRTRLSELAQRAQDGGTPHAAHLRSPGARMHRPANAASSGTRAGEAEPGRTIPQAAPAAGPLSHRPSAASRGSSVSQARRRRNARERRQASGGAPGQQVGLRWERCPRCHPTTSAIGRGARWQSCPPGHRAGKEPQGGSGPLPPQGRGLGASGQAHPSGPSPDRQRGRGPRPDQEEVGPGGQRVPMQATTPHALDGASSRPSRAERCAGPPRGRRLAGRAWESPRWRARPHVPDLMPAVRATPRARTARTPWRHEAGAGRCPSRVVRPGTQEAWEGAAENRGAWGDH